MKTIARKMKFVRCHICHESLQAFNQEMLYVKYSMVGDSVYTLNFKTTTFLA